LKQILVNMISKVELQPSIESKSDEETDVTFAALKSLLQLIEQPQNLIHTILLSPSASNHEHRNQVNELRKISKELFSRLENLAFLQEKIERRSSKIGNDDDDLDLNPLSGLPELYTGSNNETEYEDEKDNENLDVDTETIFNQVDIQNSALLTKVKKNVRKLSKLVSNEGHTLRLLDMEDMKSDGESSEIDNYDDSGDDENIGSDDEEQDEDGSEDEDEETKRIRERMERSMVEMDDSIDDTGDEDEEESDTDSKTGEEGVLHADDDKDTIDPAREDLYDGFFDLHEMEGFADEEEEMLPDEAYGEPEPQNELSLEERKQSLPHVKGRQGNDLNDDEDDEEFNALERQVETSQAGRKRYRDDGDINALFKMYQDMNDLSDSEDEEDEVINMTASDYFGPPKKPSQAFMRKSKEVKKVTLEADDDDDSWNDHDFTAEGKDWRDDGSEAENSNGQTDDQLEEEKDDDEELKTLKDNHKEDVVKESKKSSRHAERSNKLEEMTKELEKELLAEKPWQMVGETKGTQRPTNSLLEVTPTFEFATKMAPMVTVEHTLSIEEMIKKRILAEDWDDIVPRELPDIGLDKRNGELPEVSQEKSKLSLGELYEREYLKKTAGYDVDAAEKETEEEKAKNEMKMLFANICSKLDALSNYHFAPRPVADEAEVKTTATPAVAMEEVLPLHVSDAQALAPEEVYGKKKGRESILRGESEMDQTDRKKLRQSKKAARRKSRKAKLADEKLISRLKPELGLNNPYEKRKMREELQMARASGKVVTGDIDHDTDYKTSTKFFQRMQSEVQQSINEDVSGNKRKRNGTEDTKKSSSFKL